MKQLTLLELAELFNKNESSIDVLEKHYRDKVSDILDDQFYIMARKIRWAICEVIEERCSLTHTEVFEALLKGYYSGTLVDTVLHEYIECGDYDGLEVDDYEGDFNEA